MANDYFNPPNSVWPNGLKRDEEGYVAFYPLGTNKVEVPTSSSEWPKGDELISPFVYDKDDKLVGFVDTKALTTDSQTTIYLPYTHIEADFSAIDKGQLQIHAPNATTKKASWKNSGVEDIPEAQFKYKDCKTVDNVITIDANYQISDIVDGAWSEPLWDLEDGSTESWNGIFAHCKTLTTFSSDLPKLTNGYCMFYQSSLSEFSSDLPILTDSSWMFASCGNLILFNSDLSSLTNSTLMFEYCRNLTSFTVGDLSSLTNGDSMFSGCSSLTSFNSDLSSLTNGDSMFVSCESLTSFNSDLSSLTNGRNMFWGCKLDVPSVKNIINTINTYSDRLALGMGCDNTETDKNLFAQEVGYADMTSLLAVLQSKGWTVTTQYNGRPTTTYSLRRPSEDTLSVFVKLEETEDRADYTSLDDSKKFRLDWFHETTGSTEGYTQYATLEEAIEALNIKPIERN